MQGIFTKKIIYIPVLCIGILFFLQNISPHIVTATSTQPTTLTSQTSSASNPASQSAASNIDCSSPSNSGNFNCYKLLTPLPNPSNPTGQGLSSINVSNPVPYIITIAEILVSLGVVLAVFFIVYGGIIKMTAVDNVNQQQKGLAIIKNSVFGLLLLAFSYILIVTINPNLLNNPFTTISSIQGTATNLASSTSKQMPSNIQVNSCVPGTGFYLTWNMPNATPQTKYNVYVSPGSNYNNKSSGFETFKNQQGGVTAGTPITFAAQIPYTAITTDQVYSVWMSALYTDGTEGPSAGTTFTCKLAPPKKVVASCNAQDGLLIIGDATAGVSDYTAHINTCNSGSNYTNNPQTTTEDCKIDSSTGTFGCPVFQAVPGNTYCVWVNAMSVNIGQFQYGGQTISTSQVTNANPVTCQTLPQVTNLQASCKLQGNNPSNSYIGPGGLTITWNNPNPNLYKNFDVYFNPTNQTKNTPNFSSTPSKQVMCDKNSCVYKNNNPLNTIYGFHTFWVNTVINNSGTNQTVEGVNNGASGVVQCLH